MGDKSIILLKDKATNELYINLKDIAELLYYPDEVTMLSQDVALDSLNQILKETGKFPIQNNLGSSTLLRKLPINEK
jgi:hypothetical protein